MAKNKMKQSESGEESAAVESATVEPGKTKFCEKEINAEEGSLSFIFGNGTTLKYNILELPEGQQHMLKLHGAAQKGGDAYASAKGDYTLAIASVQKVFDNLTNDKWVASRASGEAKPASGELAQALATIKGMDLATVIPIVDNASEEQRSAWRKHPAVALAIAQARAARAAARAAEAGAASADTLML